MFQNGSPALTSPSSARTFLTRRLADELRRELQVDARTELLHKALLYAIQRDKVNALETLLLHSAEVQMCACELACVPMRVPACLPFSSSADKALDVACKSDSGERGNLATHALIEKWECGCFVTRWTASSWVSSIASWNTKKIS
jgi:hypothetical protein